ncbi:hypothetical protein FKW77_000654 [Venturia effusa]|uniref:Uncharacterized protein n=1 Tax=Venturia effusa TaxID=50376 RepID=A0A517LPH2_9PEZI|nr:hypothetical protein FKW77_000654 [Venturia effusa]
MSAGGFECRVLVDVSRAGFLHENNGAISAPTISSDRQDHVGCAPGQILASITGANPEQILSMTAFFTPWLPEDGDGLAPWIETGIKDLLREDEGCEKDRSLYGENTARPSRNLSLPDNSKDKRPSFDDYDILSDSDGSTPQAHCQVENVAAAASLLHDEQYVNALKICCIHELRGKKCTSIKCSEKSPLLCQNFKKGTCEITDFAHSSFTHVHILPNCSRAIKLGKCCRQGCRLGHDNLALRRKRLAEKRETEMWWARLWIKNIEAGMKAGATPLDLSACEDSVVKLRGKLGQFRDAAMAGKVDDTLAQYRQYCRRRSWAGGG